MANKFDEEFEWIAESNKIHWSNLSNLVDNLTEGIHKIKSKEYDRFIKYEKCQGQFYKI